MVRGLLVVTSTEHKLNTWISTEADIFGVDDCIPAVCWTRYLIEAQEQNFTENIFYQDNQSATLLENNGK